MMKPLKLIIIIALFNMLTDCKGQDQSVEFSDEEFKAGQVWKYKTRVGEEKSTLTILKVEKYDSAVIIHISVNNVKLRSASNRRGSLSNINHMPLSRDAVLKSIIALKSEDVKLLDFKEGYNLWREVYVKNEGGVFSISVAEAVDYIESTIAAK